MAGKDGASVRHLFACDANNADTIGIQAFAMDGSVAIIQWHPSTLGCGYALDYA
jgi:hypothetical protein